MAKRRPVGKKNYTIAYLLDKQPKSLSKAKHYNLMMDYFLNSTELYNVRFNRRCYSLLNEAVIKPEHLDNFYRTYRLPKNSFFPLFFMIKRDYLQTRERKKWEKKEYIAKGIEELPPYIKYYFNILKDWEEHYNRINKSPLYNRDVMAHTKKKIDQYQRFSHEDWSDYLEDFIVRLRSEYRLIPEKTAERLLSCFILICLPPDITMKPDRSTVMKNYRSLSKKHHPDAGGDPARFIKLKWARDILIHTTI